MSARAVDISELEARLGALLAENLRLRTELAARAQTEEALRQSERRKDEFLAVLAHELRNPLAPLRVGLDLLQRAGSSPEALQDVSAMMRRQVDHMTHLLDDLLDLARIGHGKLELQRADVDLRTVIEDAIEVARPRIAERGHRLIVECPDAPLIVAGDAQRLVQVLGNLLGNAAKYTEAGGTIRLHAAAEADKARVSVRDTGIGIPPEWLEEIFGLFAQVPEHRAHRGGAGLGIGLALSRRLVALHGGSLSVASDGIGRGSEFTVRLPLRAAAAG